LVNLKSNATAQKNQKYSDDEATLIHEATLKILSQAGVGFESERALDIFRRHGFQVDGSKVIIAENRVSDALNQTPNRFTLHARNPDHSIDISRDTLSIAPTGGAPFINQIDGSIRSATMADFELCCQLVQTSKVLNLGGYLMVQPSDIEIATGHLDMLATYFKHCDKPIIGASNSGLAAKQSLEMAALIFDGHDQLKKQPAMIMVVDAISPLRFSAEQADVIIEMASFHQPLVISTMVMAGSTGPVSLAGVAALQNAEILAGIVLAQLVSPGNPVVYGSTSAPMDMKTTISAVGAYETAMLSELTCKMAQFYQLPGRSGGSLTDAHAVDSQALAEGTLLLATVVQSGVNFIFQGCGQMASYSSMSFEKWLIDEEICSNICQLRKPIEISEASIDAEFIISVGSEGQYLTHPKTFNQFKNLSQPNLFNRDNYLKWTKLGAKRIDIVAHEQIAQCVSDYSKPNLEPTIKKALDDYVLEEKTRRGAN